jgi:hypothetical protein
MATNITAKLNKAANVFQAGESTGFGLRLGVQYYDRETKQKEWTNYEAAVFARNPQQVQFYQQALVEGAIVEINAQQEKVKQFQGQNGLHLSIELIDAKLGYVHSPQGAQAPQQGFNQQQGYQQPQQQHTGVNQVQQSPQQWQQQQQQQSGINDGSGVPF